LLDHITCYGLSGIPYRPGFLIIFLLKLA